MSISSGSGLSVPWLQKKEDRAIHVISSWLTNTQSVCFVSVSGGKDSLVVADLTTRIYPECPLVWVNQGPLAEWDDCVELLELWKQQGRNVVELCPVRSLLNLYLDFGVPLDGTMNTALDKKINQHLMYDPLDEYQGLHGIKGYAWGIRKSESRGRANYLKSRGELYQNKDGLWVCSPVGFWDTASIWQYIDKYKLPYPAMYDRDRMSVRNGPPIGTTGVNWGRLVELRKHHPELWQQFIDKFPAIRNYG